MKNIHVKPTDNPSRLIGNNLGFILSENNNISKYLHLIEAKYYNIYITSDEEIKDGYVLNIFNNTVYKIVPDNSSREILANPTILPLCSLLPEHYVKIILTTDLELIKDGVQAIDDEFLEWFVKNPSCEDVEVKCYSKFNDGDFTDYKIIIPREEQVVETTLEDFRVNPKQKNIEEVAERLVRQHPDFEVEGMSEYQNGRFNGIIEGIKWQQEQDKKKFSEEEVKNIAEEVRWQAIGNPLEFTKNFKVWIEKIKKI